MEDAEASRDKQAQDTTPITRRHSDDERDRSMKLSSSDVVHMAELPSYRLRRDRKAFSTLSIQTKRASAGSYFSPPSSSHEDAQAETNPVKTPNRRASFRPLLAAATMTSLLSTKVATVEEHESKQHEAMVQRFQVRRLASNGQQEAPKNSSTESNEDGKPVPIIDGIALDALEQMRASQSRSHSSRRKSFARPGSQRATDGTKASNHSVGAQDDYMALARGLAASKQGRFSLARLLRTWKRKIRIQRRQLVAQLLVPMSPFSAATEVRGMLLFISCVWYISYLPIQIAFSVGDSDWSTSIEVFIEVLFIADFLLGFNTSFVDKSGDEVVSRRQIAWNYVTSWCLPDLLSSVPVRMIAVGRHSRIDSKYLDWSGAARVLRFFHVMLVIRMIWFLRARRARKGFSAWLLYSRYSHLHRIAYVLLWIVFIAHWMACGWKLLGSGDSSSSITLAEDYAANFYDALQLLQGQGLATDSLGQNLFAAFAVLIGSIVLAVVFGNVAVLISNFNANSTNYQRKIETIFAIMTKLQLPVLLRERIHQYYEHLWREYESLDGQLIQFSKELTHTLELEVLLFKYMEVIMRIPFWHDSSPDFLKQIVLQIQVRVYLPDDYIIRRGEIGDEYYIINRGFCEMLTGSDSFERATAPLSMIKRQSSFQRGSIVYEDPSAVGFQDNSSVRDTARSRKYRVVQPINTDNRDPRVAKLSRGQSFGEMALIMNYHRTADARAVTYVEMCVLKREHFQRILLRYPEDRKSVMTHILTHTMVNNDIYNVPCPLSNVVRAVFGSSEKDRSITAKMAASLIVQVTNIDKDDDTLKFGIGIKVHERLKTLYDEQMQVSRYISSSFSVLSMDTRVSSSQQVNNAAPAAAAPNECTIMHSGRRSARLAALESRMTQVELTQQDMLRSIQLIHEALVDIKETQDKILALPGETTVTPEPAIKTAENSLKVDPPSSNTLQPPKIRRTSSAPSTNPQVIIDSVETEAAKRASQSHRRNTQMHVAYNDPQARGIRPLLRRMSSIVKIYTGFVAQEPPPSTSQYADQLFFSRHQTPKDS